jgi:hypothetical protein
MMGGLSLNSDRILHHRGFGASWRATDEDTEVRNLKKED